VSGAGDADNASFTIVGDVLKTAARFNYEAKDSYSIRIRSTDSSGLFTEKTFTISVTDVVEIPPTVTNVFIAGGDGRFSKGIVMVSVAFSSPVLVDTTGGIPTLTLETGAVDRVIEYSRGSGTATLEFSYTIQPGDTSEDLDYASSAALALNGATIRDANDTDAVLTLPAPGAAGSIGANNQIAIDTTAPTIALSARERDLANNALRVVGVDLDEPLFGFDHTADLRLTRNGQPVSLAGAAWTGSNLQYAFDPFATFNTLPGVYELRLTAAGITDIAGNPLAADVVLSWTVGVAPTDIALSASSVRENLPAGTVVGTFSTTDADIGDSFVYALVSGTGAADNASFSIVGNELRTTKIFSVAAQPSHAIRVQSTDAAGFTTVKTFTITVAGKPGAPAGVAGTVGNASVSLAWRAPASDGGSPITNYVIEYSSNNGTRWTTFDRSASPALSATVTGLTNGLRYVFRVSAVNAAGTGAPSVNSAVVTPQPIPGAPTGLTTLPGDARVTLMWKAPPASGGPAVRDYVVEYSTTDGGTWTIFRDGLSTATAATVTGLTNGVQYVFRVSAVNSAGTGAVSLTSAAVAPRRAPNSPTGPTAVPGDGRAVVSWTAPANNGGAAITDYIVQVSTNGTTWTTFNDGTSTATTATVTNLVNGRAYMFRVLAVNVAGSSLPSTATTRVTPVTVPGSPTAVRGSFVNGEVRVTWAAPSATGGTPLTDYVVSYSIDNGTTWTTVADGKSTATSATIMNLDLGKTYLFRVAAVNAAGTGIPSASSAPLTPVVFAPANARIGAVEFGSTPLGYAFRDGGSLRHVTNAGRHVAAGFLGTGWTMRAVWASGTGYQAFWADRTGRNAVWTLDATGRFISTRTLTPAQLGQLETTTNFDLNGNGRNG
jgi:hypothetical protein